MCIWSSLLYMFHGASWFEQPLDLLLMLNMPRVKSRRLEVMSACDFTILYRYTASHLLVISIHSAYCETMRPASMCLPFVYRIRKRVVKMMLCLDGKRR